MYDTFPRSWELARASASVLRSDRELLLFPVLSGLCTALVAAAFVLPALALRVFADGVGLGSVAFALLFGFAQYAVVVFFNCALAGAALIRLEGGDPTLADGLRAARARLGPILGYAAIAATVGALLQALRQRGRNAGTRALGTGLGAAWAMADFLVAPVLVSRELGAVAALRESAALLRRTWGENAVGQLGIRIAGGLLGTGVAVAGVGLAVLAAKVSMLLGVAVAALAGLAWLLVVIGQAALRVVYAAALYRYATTGEAPAAFRQAGLGQAGLPAAA